MKKKYYFILLFVILITSALYILLGKGGTNPQVVIDAYEKEWGITIPAPTAETPIYATESSGTGNGQWATLYAFKETPSLKDSGMEQLTAKTLEQYEEKIRNFEKQTIAERKDAKASFEEHHPKLSEGDYGFYKEKNDGDDYFIAVYHNKELYTYTWHQ